MSNVADAGQGAAPPRAGESASEDASGHTAERACLNCGTLLIGSHCHACGQAAHVHRTLAAFFHDLLHGVFHFEGKIWRTLPLLAWRPGRLTREYIDGRRASYVSPIALFLFGVFLTFALFNALGASRLGDDLQLETGRGAAEARGEIDERVARLRRERDQAAVSGRATEPIDRRIADAERDRAVLEQLTGRAEQPSVNFGGGRGEALGRSLTAEWRKAKENPALLVYKVQTNAYKFSWLLVPLSVPFLWLLFPFSRRFRAYDHTVFATYSITAMLILIALFRVSVAFDLGAVAMLPVLYAPVHMYRQLKGTYALSRVGALWRTAAMLLFAAVNLTVFGSALIALAMSA
jgi:hypothetical protein